METPFSISPSLIFWLVIAGLVLWAIITYNHLVQLKHAVSKAWSNIDVLLKQRHDELPKLVEVCRQYMRFEQETLERVMMARAAASQAREQHNVAGVGEAEGLLQLGLGRLFALSEAYPDLKANDNFSHLRQRISGLESAIADRREFYNESVNINNVRIEQFPDVIIARLLDFGPHPLFTIGSGERQDPDLRSLFS
jgi:LemA protein